MVTTTQSRLSAAPWTRSTAGLSATAPAGLLAPSFVRYDLAELFSGSHGPEGASGFVAMITAAMPDFRLDFEDISGAGDRATVRLRMSGTHTGAPLLSQPAPAAACPPARCSSTALPGAAWPRPGRSLTA
jgi:SnoaL-like polyketide cyclase